MDVTGIIETLLRSEEPSVRWKVRVGALGEDPGSRGILSLQDEIRESARVRTMLSKRDADGRLEPVKNVYAKWYGTHWALVALADIGYPSGDEALVPLRDQVQEEWLGEEYFTEFIAKTKSAAYGKRGIPIVEGRYRAHSSMQGNALYAVMTLGLEDERTSQLVERLLHWQWPDGGWNCDKKPSANVSSFTETITPLRGLIAYAKSHPDSAATEAVTRASEIFLERRLFRRKTNGNVIFSEFKKLHYPLYWHFDILHGLKVLMEAGLIGDPRCEEALDLLESKRLPDGGWPAETKYYQVSEANKPGSDSLDWGGTSKLRTNDWVTADALAVLKTAGRLSL